MTLQDLSLLSSTGTLGLQWKAEVGDSCGPVTPSLSLWPAYAAYSKAGLPASAKAEAGANVCVSRW